jgi:hypothetical protein
MTKHFHSKLTEESCAIPMSLPQNAKPVITNITNFKSEDNVVNQCTHFRNISPPFLDHGGMEKSCVYLSMIYLTTLSLALTT